MAGFAAWPGHPVSCRAAAHEAMRESIASHRRWRRIVASTIDAVDPHAAAT
jgi:hypothetical protein